MADDGKKVTRTANQILCADYLRSIALLLEKGAIHSFDFIWTDNYHKPRGSVILDSQFLNSPMELSYLEELKKETIPTTDLSDNYKDHKPCSAEYREKCWICSTKS